MAKTCKSNVKGAIPENGERASNIFLTYPGLDNSSPKGEVIVDDAAGLYGLVAKGLLVWERGISYQVVGEVMAHQA
jgi:hypothetical protein